MGSGREFLIAGRNGQRQKGDFMIPAIHGKELYTEGTCTAAGRNIFFQGEKEPGGTKQAEMLYEPTGAEQVSVFCERLAAAGIQTSFSEGVSDEQASGGLLLKIDQSADLKGRQGAYRLEIEPERICISAADSEGTANALTTLYWSLRDGNGTCRCAVIEDAPKHAYRGFMLDCCRHFFDVDQVKKMIEQCALRKINRLHWHLSEDQGFRLESELFPKLNEVGSVRTEEDGTLYQGYYKKEEVRDIVHYAKVRGMEVIPEIDLPGHVSAIVAAYPQLSCSCEPLKVQTTWGVFPRILCVGKDEVMEFIGRLLDEVCALFPYEYFHIGGDEVPKDEWIKCPHCQRRIQKEGLKDEAQLQAWFTQQVQKELLKRGKKVICWNDVLFSDRELEDTCIQYWAEFETLIDPEAAKKHAYIFSIIRGFYFDYIPKEVPLRNTYQFEPELKCGLKLEGENLLGFEAPLWSEHILDGDRLEQMAFPRMLALAERAWNGERTYEEFLGRCREEIECLKADGVSSFTIEEADPAEEKRDPAEEKTDSAEEKTDSAEEKTDSAEEKADPAEQ